MELLQIKCPTCHSAILQSHTTYATQHYGRRIIYKCANCPPYFSETKKTLMAGLKTPVSVIWHVVKARTEGMGFNATARTFEKAKAISQKEFPYSGCGYRIDQNVVLGQYRMALQACFNRLHRRLTERNAFLVDFVAELDDRMKPLPSHPLGPRQHRLCVDQLRPIPAQFQNTPAALDGIIFAVVRRIIQQLNRLVNGVGELHHPMEKLRAPATAFWTIVYFDLDQTRGSLLCFIQSVPLGFEHIHDKVTRFGGAAKGDGQLCALFIDDPTGNILLLASPIVITGLVVAPGETTA